MPPQYHEIKEQAHHPHDQHGDPDQFVIQDGPCHVFEETDTRGTRQHFNRHQGYPADTDRDSDPGQALRVGNFDITRQHGFGHGKASGKISPVDINAHGIVINLVDLGDLVRDRPFRKKATFTLSAACAIVVRPATARAATPATAFLVTFFIFLFPYKR